MKDNMSGDQGMCGCSDLLDSEAKCPCLPWLECSVSKLGCPWKLGYLTRLGSTFADKFPTMGKGALC